MQASNQLRRTSLSKEAKTFVYNNYTNQQQKYSISVRNTTRQINQDWLTGVPFKFQKTSPKNNLPSYITTNAFPPGIIKLQQQRNIFTNTENTSLSKLYNISLDNGLYLFHGLLHQLIIIHQKIGHSYFNVDEWCINKEGTLIRRETDLFNQHQNKNFEETTTVDIIIQYIKKNCWRKVFDDFYLFFKRAQAKSKCDYKYTLSLVQLYCKCSKINIKKKYDISQKEKNKELRPQDFGSPCRTFCSINNSKSSNQRANTIQDECSAQFTTSNIESKSQEKYLGPRMSVKNIKKSAQITKKHGLRQYLNRMTHSNEIKNVYSKNYNKSVNDTFMQKQSSTSTSNKTINFNSLPKKDCIQSLTFIPIQGSKNGSLFPFRSTSDKEAPCFLQADLQSVESKSEHQDSQQQQQFCKKAYQTNQWTRTFNNLLGSKKQIAQSFIQGKDEVINHKGNPENLGKLARVVVQSFLNTQNNSKYIME